MHFPLPSSASFPSPPRHLSPVIFSFVATFLMSLTGVQAGNGYDPPVDTSGYSTFTSPDIIDNEVVATPLIRCTDRGVEFSINTRNPFRGNLYVQGHFGFAECRREFYNNDSPFGAIEVRLGACGMQRQHRARGMGYSLVLIANFHPRFVTRVDRAFNIHCSYQQAERPVGVDLEVGTVPSDTLESQSVVVPDCEYSMRLGDVNGPPALGTVKVGELVYHRWECQQSDVYGMLVKNCVVFDGGNDNATLLDERGCPTHTGVIQSAPVYSDRLNLAFAPVLAFHFPDRTQMNFRCQIQSCNKADNECQGLTPPNCPLQYGLTPPPPSALPSSTYTPADPYGSAPVSAYPLQHSYIGAGGLQRPWQNKHRHQQKQDAQGRQRELEQRILMATQKLRRHQDGRWPPSLVILNRTEANKAAGAIPRRFFRPLPEESELRQRQRRAEEHTQDVVASSTVINDGLQGFEWSNENGKTRVSPRILSARSDQQYCLDRPLLGTLVAALGLLSALGLTLLCHLLWELTMGGRHCAKSSVRSWRPKGSNGISFPKIRFGASRGATYPVISTIPSPSIDQISTREETNGGTERGSPQAMLASVLSTGLPGVQAARDGQRRVPPKKRG